MNPARLKFSFWTTDGIAGGSTGTAPRFGGTEAGDANPSRLAHGPVQPRVGAWSPRAIGDREPVANLGGAGDMTLNFPW